MMTENPDRGTISGKEGGLDIAIKELPPCRQWVAVYVMLYMCK